MPDRPAVRTCVCRHDCGGCGQSRTTLLSLSQCTRAASLNNVTLQINLQEKLRRLRVAGEDASHVAITMPPSLRHIEASMKTGSLTLQEGIAYEVRCCCTERQGFCQPFFASMLFAWKTCVFMQSFAPVLQGHPPTAVAASVGILRSVAALGRKASASVYSQAQPEVPRLEVEAGSCTIGLRSWLDGVLSNMKQRR